MQVAHRATDRASAGGQEDGGDIDDAPVSAAIPGRLAFVQESVGALGVEHGGQYSDAKMNNAIEECPNCNARIHGRAPQCPWCGQPRDLADLQPVRKRLSLGALITILTLAALLLWLMSLKPPGAVP
ncbi:hypothetical protein [Stieleria sp.]|uniref:hypothetical protein n=1 Tax=Stieleria sp. TaxID=2795976 RepID=UPI0035674FB8